MAYFIYIIEGRDGYLYTGITGSLRKRLFEHKKGRVRLTKNKRPLVLRYAEKSNTRQEAAKRERQIKGYSRIKKEALFSLR